MFRKALGTTAVAILSLALGIGASSAIFSLVYALWFDPYPYRDSDRLLNLTLSSATGQKDTLFVSLADYLELRRDVRTLETVVARDERTFVLTSGLPESLRGLLFSPEAFDHFGVPALLGRTFGASDLPQRAAPPRIAGLRNDGDVYVPLAMAPDPKTFVAVMLRVGKGHGASRRKCRTAVDGAALPET
jgi:hypothetical protein